MPTNSLSPTLAFPGGLPGDFETHVTFRCADAEVEALAAWGAARGAGMTHIVLGRGRTVSQPMLTLRATSTLDAARGAAAELAEAAGREGGFRAVRIKVEAAPWHPGVPADTAAAAALGPAYYFEHHVKLLLDDGFDAVRLAALVAPHAAHLSHNARRRRTDGRQERFVTQRCRGVGDAQAADALAALLAALAGDRHDVLSAEREFVVFDDDETLDHGWIDEEKGDAA